MKATCTSEVIYTKTEALTEQTAYGPYEKEVTCRVTAKHWTNYPGKVSEFTHYAVDTFWNSRLVNGYITPNLPTFAQ